jgi:spore maturation protein CgeB
LFEAAACATPIISDPWDGLQTLFVEGREVLVARDGQTVLDALKTTPEAKSATMGQAARKRVLKEHTAEHRAAQLDRHLADAAARRNRPRAKSQSGLEAAL